MTIRRTLTKLAVLFVCLTHTIGFGYATFGGNALTESSGGVPASVIYQASYGPHGEDWGSTGYNPTPFGWLGSYGVQTLNDGTPLKLYLTRHRLYSATLNRFLSADPLGIAGGLNLYQYGEGNPMSYIDPLGLCGMQSVGFGIGDYLYDVGQFGLGELSAVWNTAVGLFNAATHPIDTAEGLWNSAAHPVETANAIWDSIKGAWDNGAYGQGQVVGNAILIGGTIAAPYASARAAAAVPAQTTLYRAVNEAELKSIQSTGQFITPPGVTEGKYFTASAADASSFAKQAYYGLKAEPYTIISTKVPTSSLPLPIPVDRGGIPAYVLPESILPTLKPTILPSMPIPAR